jgi:hypothetical protein
MMGNAFAAGSITYTKKEIQESNGGWHLMMTIKYGGKPNTPHVPMRFSFTATAILENYLDDQHGDKPQKRKIPLVGQTPIHESVDVDFSDPRGKLYDTTKFDFTITRSHNFSAGDYSVTVSRPDGSTLGTAQTLVLLGDNPVIDRRAMTFVASSGKKGHDKAAVAAAADGGAPAEGKTAASAGDQGEAPAGETPPSSAAETPPPDEAANPAKVPPGSHGGCGCRTAGSERDAYGGAAGFLALALSGVARWRSRRRRISA